MNMFLSEVEKYYSDRIKQHGITSKGVDWNTEESQNLRFDQLLKIVDSDQKEFSVLDYGCGYGALLSHINKIKLNLEIDFFGYDISNEMILKAKALFLKKSKATFQNNIPKKKQFDYVIASGVFNVKLNRDHLVWEQYVLQEITKLFELSNKGVALNFLTGYSDKEFQTDKLYYCDPTFLFDYCIKNLSRKVTLIHDYPLYEFTLHIKK